MIILMGEGSMLLLLLPIRLSLAGVHCEDTTVESIWSCLSNS